MNIFSTTATELNNEIDSAMSILKSTITKLKDTSEKAAKAKANKLDIIEKLESECFALAEVSTRANKLVVQLEELFEQS